MAKTTPEVSEDISGALKRLTEGGRGGMGSMFKVVAISDPALTVLAGFADDDLEGCRADDAGIALALRHSRPAPRLLHPRGRRVRRHLRKASMAASARRTMPSHVAENRRRMAAQLGVAPTHLLTAFQIHSPDVVVATEPWEAAGATRADAIVTRTEGLAIGITAADCGPILLVDPGARVIGAAHAGWKGALTGILEFTVEAMEKLGADRSDIVAAIGPLIRQHFYEVGTEFVERFLEADAENVRFFLARGDAQAIRCSTSAALSACGWKAPAC